MKKKTVGKTCCRKEYSGRSSCPEVFSKLVVHKNFVKFKSAPKNLVKFKRKHLCQVILSL